MTTKIQIRMGGYGPATNTFNRGLTFIGDKLKARFGDRVEVRYVYDVLGLGYTPEELWWLVESGMLTLAYMSTSSITDRIPEIGIADLPFLFANNDEARAAVDGAFGRFIAEKLEENADYRVLGFFENGFRHVSNSRGPIRKPEDFKGLRIRTLNSAIQARTFELLGAEPLPIGLREALEAMKEGRVNAQENPFANTTAFGVHKLHRFHTMTGHFYISRAIFAHRPTFDRLPEDIQAALREFTAEAVPFQRDLAVQEELDARKLIEEAGGEVVTLTDAERQAFRQAVAPIYGEAHARFGRTLERFFPSVVSRT